MKKIVINKKTIIFVKSEVLSNISDKELGSLREKLKMPVWKFDKSYENIIVATVDGEKCPSLFIVDDQYFFGYSFKSDFEIRKETDKKFLDELVRESGELVTSAFILLNQ